MPNKYLDSVQLGRLITKIKTYVNTAVAGFLPTSGGSITGNLTVSGTITGNLTGNVTGNADTATSATNDGNGDAIASTYLPLSGGTMTGNIVFDSGSMISGASDSQNMRIRSGTDDTSSYISLYGKNAASYTGQIVLRARDANHNRALVLDPSGTLTWLGDNVLTDATVGTVRTNSNSSNVNLTANTTTKITSVTLSAGTWVVTGHLQYTSVVTRQFASLNDSGTLNASIEGTAVHYAGSSSGTTLALCVTRIFELSSSTEIRLNGFASVACTAGTSHITAVRIK